jgi:hypothetical protein
VIWTKQPPSPKGERAYAAGNPMRDREGFGPLLVACFTPVPCVCCFLFSFCSRVCCFFVSSALLVRDKMYLVSSVGWNGEVCICVSCNCVCSHRCSTTNIRHLPCECWRLRCSDVLSQLHVNNRVDERAMQYA